MKTTTLKKMQDFVGKVCSILTTSVAKSNFTDIQFSDFFVVIVEEVSEDGIFGKHAMTGCLSFYAWNHVVGIFQEQVIDQEDPQYENILSEVKKSQPEQQVNIIPVNPQTGNSPYVNPDVMSDLVRQAQEYQQKMLQKKTGSN